MAVAKEYQGKPVIFIGVNSGNSPKTVAGYLRQNGVSWPTIVDSSRALEKAWLGSTISLNNVQQVRTVNSKGRTQSGGLSPSGLKAAADGLLKDAKWNVDPTSIPASMKPLWSMVEYGNFAMASKMLNKSLKSKKPEVKAAADSLNEHVQSRLQPALSEASQHKAAERQWEAYKAYSEIKEKFDGYEMADLDLDKVMRDLKSQQQVKDELLAMKKLQALSRKAAKSGVDKKMMNRLEKFIESYPGTDAAGSATRLLEGN